MAAELTMPKLSDSDGGGDDPPLAEGPRASRSSAASALVEIETDKATVVYEAESDGGLA